MRRLLLLRHAKAERSHSGGRDHERHLADRGRDDAPRVGAYISRHDFVPDKAVVSTSTRTRETWKLVAGAMESGPEAEFDERIYEASAKALLDVVKETDSSVNTLLLVGHNPGMQELATMLVATGDVDTRQRLKEAFPTSALAVIEFKLKDWSKVHPQSGRLERFIDRHSIAAETD